MARRFWLMLPSLAALILVMVLIPRTTLSALDAARAHWDARPFTRYQLIANYTRGFTICNQEVYVEGDRVVFIIRAQNCDTQTPLPNIQYPSVSDIFNYLQAQAAQLARQTNCLPQRQLGVKGIYDNQFGYPVRAEIGWIFNSRWSLNLLGFNTLNPACIGGMIENNIIQILSLTPQ
jgi:hypothetical protein